LGGRSRLGCRLAVFRYHPVLPGTVAIVPF
jgi:hypothetical protein